MLTTVPLLIPWWVSSLHTTLVPWWVYIPGYICLPTYPGYTMQHAVHGLVYTVCTLAGTVLNDEALGSNREKPVGGRGIRLSEP